MKARNWTIGWLTLVITALVIVMVEVVKVDPYFHYHKPDIANFYYELNNQRSQNNGIVNHFDYNALITGTSMTENFKTSEMDVIFDVNSIKVPFSGGSYKEINDNVAIALENNSDLKTIVRCLDYGRFFDDKNLMREDLGTYPTYLYDSNPLNDVKYIFNKDIIFDRVYDMYLDKKEDTFNPGITAFDNYSRWQNNYTFGVNSVLPNGVDLNVATDAIPLTDEDKTVIYGNISQNVTSLADKYPDVKFYYFFSPYSAAWWNSLNNAGAIKKQIEAEKYVIELILQHPNIKLYSFNNLTDITTDLNNYKDASHYGEWINSMILRWMKDGKCLLTKDNYLEYLNDELDFYSSFDYSSLSSQIDYESDYYVAALLNSKYKGVEPLELLGNGDVEIELSNAQVIENQHYKKLGIQCIGSLQRSAGSEMTLENYIMQEGYVGSKIKIKDIGERSYLVFYGKKVKDHGQPTVYIYNNQNKMVRQMAKSYQELDNEWHQYVIDLSGVDGSITVVLNGGYIDNTGSIESTYVFSDLTLY